MTSVSVRKISRLRTALPVVVGLAAMGLVGTGSGCRTNSPASEPPPATPAHPTTPAAALAPSGAQPAPKPIGEAAMGDRTKCPVSGEVFTVNATSPSVEHQGKTYYFCCAGCDKKFQQDPSKFLQPK